MDELAKRTYICLHLERARDDLNIARDNLGFDHYRGAANRAYYTIFHAASAALLWSGIERSRHTGVQAAFSQFLVKSGIIEPMYSKIYTKAQKVREEQDYDLSADSLSEEEIQQLVDDSEQFLSRIEQYLGQVGVICNESN
jgi:uncharacterized protein (UPF0332 family)